MHARMIRNIALTFFVLFGVGAVISGGQAQKSDRSFAPTIPRTWDDDAIASLELPLANPVGSPKHVGSDYYYSIPVAPIYKSYPIYAPGHEPPGYIERLKEQEPLILWNDAGRTPPLETDADWIKAGEIVFDAAITYNSIVTLEQARDPLWYSKVNVPVAGDGTIPFLRYIIRQKGTVEVGQTACAQCHIRVMPDGSILKGAQGNFDLNRAVSYRTRSRLAQATNPIEMLMNIRLSSKAQWSMPWLSPDPLARIDEMSFEELEAANEARPFGVMSRHRSSIFYPVQVPDLIGVKDRRYLDRTGLQQHRSIADLMRYAAMNRGSFQGGDLLANHNGFIPADPPNFKKLPAPATQSRYSDEQLYALALYIYSLVPPLNPNKFDALAERGQRLFLREGCAMCHTPPLYTNNKLTPADGFTVPMNHLKKYDVSPVSVGTDANLTVNTRRGAGYYKVPSLKGVWYRSMFGHSGWCATLEDWFDPRRTRDDYVPIGFKPSDVKMYAVKGHVFGLNLSAEDRQALIAFLKTL